MATFYLLPPRAVLGACFASTFLSRVFPDHPWPRDDWRRLADLLEQALGVSPEAFVVFRDDLPDGDDPTQALVDGFGAEPGDEIIEVRRDGETNLISRRWPVVEAIFTPAVS